MSKHFFDYDDGDFAMSISDNMAMDTDGNLMMRMGDNMAMDMDTGDIHFISSWSRDEDELNLIAFLSRRVLTDNHCSAAFTLKSVHVLLRCDAVIFDAIVILFRPHIQD